MTIVLDENEWAKDMIDQHSLGKKPFETLSRVAKYYMDQNYNKKDVRRLVEAFLLRCDPFISIPKWADTIEYAINRAAKLNAIKIEYITITKQELEKIDAIAGRQTQRLAFTLLCLAKYWDAVNPQGDHWVNNKDSEIMKMANINTSIKRQSLMYHELNAAGLIRFSKKVDNTNVRVCFTGGTDIVLKISDFRNLGYQYLKYRGEPFFECQNCGIVTKYNNPVKGAKQRYCKECAAEIALQQRVNSVMRQRGKMLPS